MYRLYIDESGNPAPYVDGGGNVIDGRTKYFTLGGIIVDDRTKADFDSKIEELVCRLFHGIDLPDNFKLHYHPLRQKRPPYDQLSDKERLSIPNSIFSWIENSNCRLLSVTVNLRSHYQKYTHPIDPIAYALRVMLERFQYFLEDNDGKGTAIYEKFNAKMRKKAEADLKWLRRNTGFRFYSKLSNVEKPVVNGDPAIEPILQMADFFAYLPWLWHTTGRKAHDRLDRLARKMYNLGGEWNESGFTAL